MDANTTPWCWSKADMMFTYVCLRWKFRQRLRKPVWVMKGESGSGLRKMGEDPHGIIFFWCEIKIISTNYILRDSALPEMTPRELQIFKRCKVWWRRVNNKEDTIGQWPCEILLRNSPLLQMSSRKNQLPRNVKSMVPGAWASNHENFVLTHFCPLFLNAAAHYQSTTTLRISLRSYPFFDLTQASIKVSSFQRSQASKKTTDAACGIIQWVLAPLVANRTPAAVSPSQAQLFFHE